MLRQITESVVISKIREDDLMNSKSEWSYVRILRTVVNQYPHYYHGLLFTHCYVDCLLF